MVKAQRTVNPLHFEDLEPYRFEDLVRQVAYNFRTWRYLDATGRLGKDEGLDIQGIELVLGAPEQYGDDDFNDEDDEPVVDERAWSIQCKRYREIGPSKISEVIEESLPESRPVPYGLTIAAACDVSAATMAKFREEAFARGVREAHLWTKAHLEDILFRPDYDHLLFAYFGLSLGAQRQSRLRAVRHDLTVKRKLLKALKWESSSTNKLTDVLIRNIDDEHYPQRSDIPDFDEGEASPWHVGTAEFLDIRGLVIWRFAFSGCVKEDGRWATLTGSKEMRGGMAGGAFEYWKKFKSGDTYDRTLAARIPQSERKSIRECWILPLHNILEIDSLGDILHPDPHLFCRFHGEYGPYEYEPVYFSESAWGNYVQLDDEKRTDVVKLIDDQPASNDEPN